MESIPDETCNVLTQKEEKKFICDTCNLRFSYKSSLKKHEKRHSIGKIFTCEFCERSFYRKDCLRVHKMIHFDEKPFSCDLCSYACRTSYRMKVHKKIKHSADSKTEQKEKKTKKKCMRGLKIKAEQSKTKKKHSSKPKKTESVKIELQGANMEIKENQTETTEEKIESEEQRADLYDVYKGKTRHHKRHNIFEYVSSVTFECYVQDLSHFFKNLKLDVYNELFFQLLDKNKIQWYVIVTATLTRLHPEGYFDYLITHLRSEVISQLNDDNLLETIDYIFHKITRRFDEFNTWTFLSINFLELNIAKI